VVAVSLDFAGGLKLSNALQIAILQERTSLGEESELSFTFAATRERNHTSLSGDTSYTRDTRRSELFARADVQLRLSERHRSRVGVMVTRRDQRFEGQVTDIRDLAPWSSRPFTETDAGYLDIRPRTLRSLLAGYVEHTYRPGAKTLLEGSARLQGGLSSGSPTYSLHLALSQELPTATVLKVSAGAATQLPSDPLLLDATYGNPSLEPERSVHLIAGLEQPLPFQALLRLEGFGKWFSSLAVNPDSRAGVEERLRAGQPVFESAGSGFARGVDLLLLGRSERLAYGAALGLVFAERHNPLASGPRRYRAPWDQRFTASAHLSYTPSSQWVLSGRVSFHTGRPYTPVEGFVADEVNGRYLPVFGETNSARYPGFIEGSARAERRFMLGPLRAAWYAEVINVTNAQNVFTYVYDGGSPEAGQLPERAEFNHLPIRPFLGIGAEY
jgi:hypothetical protein